MTNISGKYAFLQLIAAQTTGNEKRASQWKNVLSGMLTGELTIGSRTPVSDMPAWATPEVVRGGFATGGYAAGGQLLEHEKDFASELRLQTKSVSIVRQSINTWFLSDAGVERLKGLIHERRFRVGQPEEAALLTVALLADIEPEKATKIVAAISPFFDRLRFYPRILKQPLTDGIHVRSVNQVSTALSKVKPSKDIQIQAATLEIWIPLYDRLIDLLDTIDAVNWKKRANRWLEDYRGVDKENMSKRWSAPKSPFTRCRMALERLVSSKTLSAKEQTYISVVITRHQAKHGTGDARHLKREEQVKQNVQVWFDEVSAIVLERTRSLHGEDGIASSDEILQIVSSDEARPKAPAHAEIPAGVQKKVKAAQKGTIAELIQGGQIGSPEVLAEVLPQMTANIHASGFKDENTASVFRETYKAFHQRRSLLLLNLESQIKLTELPWIEALLNKRSTALRDIDLSRTSLSEFVFQTLTHFPYTQFPNPLVEQMQDLGRRADVKVPFVPELAADIFMGSFSPRFEEAAIATAQHYEGKLYSRYFDLPYRIEEGTFAKLCYSRAETSSRQGSSVAQNGVVLEQAMILTSHNMAAVFSGLDLSGLKIATSAQTCFEWICRRLSLRPATYHAELISLKNAAYAWRQMIALLSELEHGALLDTLKTMEAMLGEQPMDLKTRLGPVMTGLRAAALDEEHRTPHSQQFLGWTLGPHPLAHHRS